MSRAARMIEGGIRFDHPAVRAAIAHEEWVIRIRLVSPPRELDGWLAIAKREGYQSTYERICRGDRLDKEPT